MLKIAKVKNRDEGNLKAHEILKKIVDSQTLLVLSGGTSPDYGKMLAISEDTESRNEGTDKTLAIAPGAVCVVDERYGEPFHEDSNELLLKNSGVIGYLDLKNIDFYKILEGRGVDQTVEDYDQLMSEVFVKYPRKVGVMGVGTNLHTAGIFPNSEAVKSNHLVVYETVDDKQSLRSSSFDKLRTAGLKFPQRVTLTLKALGEFQNFVILVFGSAKQNALRIMLDEKENDMQKYPAIFYRKGFAKAWLITDQDI